MAHLACVTWNSWRIGSKLVNATKTWKTDTKKRPDFSCSLNISHHLCPLRLPQGFLEFSLTSIQFCIHCGFSFRENLDSSLKKFFKRWKMAFRIWQRSRAEKQILSSSSCSSISSTYIIKKCIGDCIVMPNTLSHGFQCTQIQVQLNSRWLLNCWGDVTLIRFLNCSISTARTINHWTRWLHSSF